ncbi:hypothetical protein H7F51_02260 [Novosphingobium flavum]|uniref:Uncharacterized protein n=1 Tax=Novosphingobium flavum TaxID=1778672 RepID=A0A7X1FP26_9SPHN|nr:hypothetical protein [Novosphingobium flavum]MBC2664336.1 hypothetical protein [Novosphingobium flavum]
MSVSSRPFAAALPLAALIAGGAYADTRSAAAIPAKAAANAAAPQSTPQSTPQGPKAGFPDSPGLDRAREVANEHARFLRPDSEG